MFSLLEALLLVLPVLLALYVWNFYTYWTRRKVLQATPVPFFGNYSEIGRTKHFRDITQNLYNKFKGQAPLVGAYIFIKKAAIILDVDLVKQILVKDFTNFSDRGIYSNTKNDPLTGHLIALEGDEWRTMRHKLTPVFTAAKMKYMFPTVVKVGHNLSDVLRDCADLGVVEVKDLCARYTTDVIGNCVFGIESNSLKDCQEEFRLRGRSVFTNQRHHPVIEQFILTNPGISKMLGLKLFRDDLTQYFLDLMQQTVDYRLESKNKHNDFIDLLMELRDEDEDVTKSSRSIDLSQGLTLEQMTAQAFSFFVAGYESSSTTMAFCLYELARHPHIQERLRQEILHSLEESKGELSYEVMQNLSYLDQVIAGKVIILCSQFSVNNP